jgi:hypothetical protein
VARASGGPPGTLVSLEIGRAASAARQLVSVSLQPPQGGAGWVRYAAAGAPAAQPTAAKPATARSAAAKPAAKPAAAKPAAKPSPPVVPFCPRPEEVD